MQSAIRVYCELKSSIMTRYSKKLLGWMIALVLILACAPAVITPVPTLDSKAISTYIAQTANAASIRTALAQPTVYVTSTLASTFTPEPTFTNVPVIIFPTSTPEMRTQYFRVRHDNQLAIYNYRSRTADDSWDATLQKRQTPEVVGLFLLPKLTAGTNRTDMSGIWADFLSSLNDYDPKRLLYIKSDKTALFNTAGFPNMESLTMGGNIITLDEIKNGWGRIHTMDYSNPGSFDGIDYKTRPDLIHKFVLVAWDKNQRFTYWTNPPPPYENLYWPLVSSKPVWIPMEYLEAFPPLPMNVTANTTQDILLAPDPRGVPAGDQLIVGKTATVMEYYPSGSMVWGKLASGKWIVLFQYQKTGPKYPTSWTMRTLPPFP
jgi:hypothetical protein